MLPSAMLRRIIRLLGPFLKMALICKNVVKVRVSVRIRVSVSSLYR